MHEVMRRSWLCRACRPGQQAMHPSLRNRHCQDDARSHTSARCSRSSSAVTCSVLSSWVAALGSRNAPHQTFTFRPCSVAGQAAAGGRLGRRGGGSPADLGQVFYSILVEFWLTDTDEPMPAAAAAPPASAGKAGQGSIDALDRAALPPRYAQSWPAPPPFEQDQMAQSGLR